MQEHQQPPTPTWTWTHLASDQPGRVLAVLVFAPIIFWKGLVYKDIFLVAFSVLLFAWDLFWILFKAPATLSRTHASHLGADV